MPGARSAAVLILLYHDQGAERVLLTRRTDTLEHHKGQISFPGGGVHAADEDLGVTALRETWEEVGVRPDDVELLGRIDDMLTSSNFVVAPYVGVLRRTPYELVPSELEVAEVIEPPLADLLDEGCFALETWERDGETRVTPVYYWREHRIWGATARMLQEFRELLRGDGARLADVRTRTEV